MLEREREQEQGEVPTKALSNSASAKNFGTVRRQLRKVRKIFPVGAVYLTKW